MKKYLLYTHGGSGNHGCEAIARTAIEMIEKCDSGPKEILLATYREDEDERYLSDKNIRIVPYANARNTDLIKIAFAVSKKMGSRNHKWYYDKAHKRILDNVDADTVAISIGGDNYCYGSPTSIYHMNEEIRKRGATNILFGCSVNSDALDARMIEDLKGYDLIHVRETLTLENLKAAGITDNVVLYPDTAFSLKKTEVKLDEEFFAGNVIGINLSPLLNRFSSRQGMALDSFIELISHILVNTTYKVALIPHVIWAKNDDREPLSKIYDHFIDSGRVKLIEDHNCMELKHIISKCELFVGARTHATIAAYTSKVPTLVVGYSVKALGIAKDLLGTHEDNVITIQDINESGKLIEAFNKLNRDKELRRWILEKNIAEYSGRIKELEQVYMKAFHCAG